MNIKIKDKTFAFTSHILAQRVQYENSSEKTNTEARSGGFLPELLCSF